MLRNLFNGILPMLRNLFNGILKGGNSSTIRLTGLFGLLWGALSQSQMFTDTMQTNPELMTVLAGVQTAILMWNRWRKPHEDMKDKPRLFIDPK